MPSLMAVLGLDASGFRGGLQAAQVHATRTGRQISSALSNSVTGAFAGLVGVGAITAFTKQTISWASSLRDVADNLGVNVEWLQKMANGANLVGSNIQDVGKFINEMNKSRQDAILNPTGKNALALGRLGATQEDIKGLSTQAFFDKLIAAFANGATTQSANDIQEVGGKSARNLVAAFAAQFANDTPILAEEIINQLDDIGDAFTRLKTTLMVDLAPAISASANGLMGFIDWIKKVGAAAGAGSGNIGWKDIIGVGLGPMGAQNLINKLFGSDESGQAILDEEARQKKQADAIKSATDAEKANRKRREQSAPLFQTEKPNLAGVGGEKNYRMSLNALQQVGGYASVPPGMQEMLNLQKGIKKATEKTASNTEPRSDSDSITFG